MAMKNPPHPGSVVRRECLEPLGLTVTEAAKGLVVTRQALSDLVNEKAGISVEMAIRLVPQLEDASYQEPRFQHLTGKIERAEWAVSAQSLPFGSFSRP